MSIDATIYNIYDACLVVSGGDWSMSGGVWSMSGGVWSMSGVVWSMSGGVNVYRLI